MKYIDLSVLLKEFCVQLFEVMNVGMATVGYIVTAMMLVALFSEM